MFDIEIPYWVRNLPNRMRGLKQEMARMKPVQFFTNVGTLAELRAVVIRADGSIENFGVLSRRVVTTTGVAWLATAFTNTVEPETLNFHDAGTGVGAELIGNTTMGTPFGGARVVGTQSTPGSTNIYRSVATIPFTSSLAITEHGLFTASTAGTLFDRSVFSAINVLNGDSIQFTWELTLPSGG
jgi:hypothetical protein